MTSLEFAMPCPNTNPERGYFVGGWNVPGGPATADHLWRCERDGRPGCFRGDVWRSGTSVASFTAPTLERLKGVLEKKYGER